MTKAALVTGASRGIGRGIALELARLGFDLLLCYRFNHSAAEETAKECSAIAASNKFLSFAGDIGSARERAALVEFARANFPRLDLLVNNAGIAPKVRVDLLEAGEESFDELLRVNVKGPYFLTQSIARWMIQSRQRAEEDYAPRIITIGSISAFTASVNRGDYCISKAALSMLTPLFAARLAEHRIHAFEIRPGIVATDMTSGVHAKYDTLIEQGLAPIQRWGKPEDVAKAVAAIATGHFPFSTGEVIHVDGGFHLRRL